IRNLQMWFAKKWNGLVTVDVPNEEEARLGRLFNILMVISVGVVTALAMAFIITGQLGLIPVDRSWLGAAFPLAFIPISICCLIWARRGQVRVVIRLYVWVNFIGIALAAFVFDGIYSPAWLLYIWTISITGTLLTPGRALGVTGAVLAYFLLLLLLQSSGLYTPLIVIGLEGRALLDIAFQLIMLIFTVGLLTYLNTRSLREALSRLRITKLALAEERNLLRTLIDNLPDPVFVKDTESRFITANFAHLEALGAKTPEEIIGKTDADFLPREQAGRYCTEEQAVIQTGQPVLNHEELVADRTGDKKWALITRVPLRDGQGNIVGIVGMERDITDRKLAEERIKAEKEFSERLVNSISDGVLAFDSDLFITAWNPGMERMSGISEAEILGKQALNALPFLKAMGEDKPLLETLQGKTVISDDRRFTVPETGREGIFETRYFPLRNGSGEIIGGLGVVRDVTERKRAEDELRKSATIIETMVDAVTVTDMQGTITDVNDAAVAQLGYAREELIGQTTALFIAEDDLAKSHAELEKLLSGEPIEASEYRVRRKNGTESVVSLNFSVLRDSNGQSIGIIAVHRDVTERKRAEEALRVTTEQLRNIFENLDVVFFSWDPVNRRIFQISSACEKVFGLSQQALLDNPLLWQEVVHPEDTAMVGAQLAALFSGASIATEYRVVRPDGETRWLEGSIKPIVDASGNVVRADGFISDVTERRQAQDALLESEAKYSTVVEQAKDGIVVAQDGKIRFANVAALELVGCSAEEVVGKDFMGMVAPQSREMAAKMYAARMAGGAISTLYDAYLLRKDGSTVPVEVNAAHIIYDGMPSDMVFIRDITERKRAEKELRERTEALERSNRELEQFAYIASHDLQEPLRMVASYVQLLERRYKGQLDADADDFIAYAVDGATRMKTLINDLLAYSRVGTRGKPFEPVDCGIVLQQVLANLQLAIGESGTVVTHDVLPTVMADDVQLAQVFQNLIGNAIRFHSELPPEIHVGVERNDGEWMFSVRDNGIGIDPQYFDRVFVIFQRLHNREEYPGTGVGLAICRKIVERHSGRIWVESEPGKGSTFYFTLPAQEEQA
ncbi:MAG: PAS domain S-box protein, partial [Chloroflexota bacterium]|nr:PAS domain S-box protein [Chloroflexota bacterium]